MSTYDEAVVLAANQADLIRVLEGLSQQDPWCRPGKYPVASEGPRPYIAR